MKSATRVIMKLLVSRALRQDARVPLICAVNLNTPVPPGDICDCVDHCKYDGPINKSSAPYIPNEPLVADCG
jgi:hypothetical protein